MSIIETNTIGIDPEVLADMEALMRHLTNKTPVEPELFKRVEERADRVTEQIRQKSIQIDVDKLLREVRDEI